MLSIPPTYMITTLGTLMHMEPYTHDAYKEAYTKDEDFKEVFQQPYGQIYIEECDIKVDYHLQNGLLYKLDKFYVHKGERSYLIREAHTSKVVGHFGVGKIVASIYKGMCTNP
jgi:hypothetical protein